MRTAMGKIVYEFAGIPEQPTDGAVSAAINVVETEEQFDARGNANLRFAVALQTLARRKAYEGIYTDLREVGLELPAVPYSQIQAADLCVHLQRLAGALIQQEIRNDPDDVYPAGASPQELADIMNNEVHWSKDQAGNWQSRTPLPGSDNVADIAHPIARVLRRFPHGPNMLTAADVAGALEK